MLRRFVEFIQQQHLFDPSQEVLLAISGGRDSVVMGELMRRAGYRFAVAHCNFHLRPGACDRDEQFVRLWAEEAGVVCHVLQVDTQRLAAQHHRGIEEEARAQRYSFFFSLMAQYGYACVATAHHRDDSVETFFLNLFRGTGLAGLHGIRPRTAQGVVRPMLCFSRAEIDDFVAREGLRFVEDATNSEAIYRRNRIRLQLMPLLRDMYPEVDSVMAANIERLAEVEQVYRGAVADCRRRLLTPMQAEWPFADVQLDETVWEAGQDGALPAEVESDAWVWRLQLDELARLQPARTLLYELLSPFGFALSVVDDLLAAPRREPGRRFFSPTHCLEMGRDFLYVVPQSRLRPPTGQEATVADRDGNHAAAVPSQVWWGEASVRDVAALQRALRQAPSWLLCVDAETLALPLDFRAWRDGDSFVPFGMKGRKLLSDLFVDRKLCRWQKDAVRLLCDARERIVWVVGLRGDNRFRVSDATRRVRLVSLRHPRAIPAAVHAALSDRSVAFSELHDGVEVLSATVISTPEV